ncbi:MAG: hypothetical protein LC655_01605, partial [Bacteroidales bacterium]|nr:hypothetical protein [Bacteroidales bacterium]
TVAEAFYLAIPVFLIPTENHYEQYCNALDAARTGMAFQLEELSDLEDFSNPVKHFDAVEFTDAVELSDPDAVAFAPAGNSKYRKWVESEEFFL